MTYTTPIFDVVAVCDKWANFQAGYLATAQDMAELELVASTAEEQPSWLYTRIFNCLGRNALDHFNQSGKLSAAKIEKAMRSQVNQWRVKAALGDYPNTPAEFITYYTDKYGITVEFSGEIKVHGKLDGEDRDILGKRIALLAEELDLWTFKTMDNALDVWLSDRRKENREATFNRLRFDPAKEEAGRAELRRLIEMIIDDEGDGRTYKLADIALRNFIYRVKNHLRWRMKNSAHLMPVLVSPNQGYGKTETLWALLKPLGDMAAPASMNAFEDNDMTYQFSIMPVMVFEELAGAARADISKLKAIMTDPKKMMRQAYSRTSTRAIVTTFIAAANYDVRNEINAKDSSGNRRIIQFYIKKADRAMIRAIDSELIWQAIDEDAFEPPMFESEEAVNLLRDEQEDQRVMSPVEQWLLDCNDGSIPWGRPTKAGKLFGSFKYWAEQNLSKADVSFLSATRLAGNLFELSQTGRFTIRITKTGVLARSRSNVPRPRS